MTDYDKLLKPGKKGTTVMAVKKKLQDSMMSQKYEHVGRPGEVFSDDLVKVVSNYAKDRVVSMQGINLTFNSEGVAKIHRHQVAAVKKEMRSRPGRYRIVDERPAPPPAPRPRIESLAAAEPKPVEPPKAKVASKRPEVSDKPLVEVKKAAPKAVKPSKPAAVKESPSTKEKKDLED